MRILAAAGLAAPAALAVSGPTKGCDKDYAYAYVWQQYRASHGSYQVCTSIVTGWTLRHPQCSSGPGV